MIFTSLLYSLRNTAPTNGGGATVGMSSFHLQTSGCTGDQNNQREARSQDFIKTEFKGKGAERLHTG